MSSPRTLLPAALLALAPACNEPAPPDLNVLLLTVDTLRADHLEPYGYGRPTSPGLDAFAETARVFDRAQATSSWTLPGLASLFTGHYTSTHGCWRFDSRLDDSFHTLAEILRDAGYDTAAVASHVFLGTDYGLHQGFVHYDEDLVHSVAASHRAISSPAVTEKGLRFLEHKAAMAAEGPWFLWLHYFDPHDVYQAHEGYAETFGAERDVDLYDGEIAFTDAHLARVLEAVDRLGLADDTLVVFTADHGEEFGDHGGEKHGHTLYRELVRVPLLIRAPGFPPGRSDSLVSGVDLLPTVLELAGLRPPLPVVGRSLVPELRGEDPGEGAVLAELRLQPEQQLEGVLQGDWKLIVDRRGDERSLYDLGADPGETRDLLAEEAEVAAGLERVLEALLESARSAAGAYSSPGSLSLLPGDADRLSDLGYGEGGAPEGAR